MVANAGNNRTGFHTARYSRFWLLGAPPNLWATEVSPTAHAPPAMKKKEIDPTAPGGEEFDIDNASTEDFAKHEEILRRRQLVSSLAPQAAPVPVTVVDAPVAAVPATPNPTDIRAIHNVTGEERYFTDITWEAMATPSAKETHAGWEPTVAKPASL